MKKLKISKRSESIVPARGPVQGCGRNWTNLCGTRN